MAKYIVVHSVRVRTEFTPETYGRLTTIGPAFLLPYGRQGRTADYQVCQCTCGNYELLNVSNFTRGLSKSCGCLQIEAQAEALTTHGMSKTPEYAVWNMMRQRCSLESNKAHANYGGRGISYCERWKKFENFFADTGLRPSPTHTLDRYPDNNGDYGPGNWRWATPQEQANNTRCNRMITIDDKTDTLANWCRFYKADYKRAHSRITRHGWDPLIALTKPVRPMKRKPKQ